VRRGSELVGYLHLKDALEFEERHRHRPIAASWVRPLVTVPVGDGLRSALETMQRSGAHLGRVVDEDGTVLGVVALEDVLEELVGEIRDEAAVRED
jgi:CBS domain containing-hemolysin-like protein